MALMMKPLRLIDTILGHAVVVLGVLVVSQVPSFMDHYLQRLGGHVAEARRNIDGWRGVAAVASDEGLDELVKRFRHSPDPSIAKGGEKLAEDVSRYYELNQSLIALSAASGFSRLSVFMRYVDLEVADAALKSFAPAIPLHTETLVYGMVGMLLSILLYSGVRGMTVGVCRRCGRRLREHRKRAPKTA